MDLDVVSRVLFLISMKHSKKYIRIPVILALVMPILLTVPNIGLDITEHMTWIANTVNIILPLSVYAFLFSLWRRVGLTTLLTLPIMCLASFQIVLLFLYGGSIIGVDMFLNVATTSVSEASELLGSLLTAIGFILILYVPPLVYAFLAVSRRMNLTQKFIRKYRKVAAVGLSLSVFMTICCSIYVKDYTVKNYLFPINIFKNLELAFERVDNLKNYEANSRNFAYNAVSTRPDTLPEVYVMVVGETSRGNNWQLAGYDRPTNPRLSETKGVVFYPKTITQSNTTHKSVPMIISDLDATCFNDIDTHKSVLTAFKEAGYKTYFLSNQKRNRSYTEFFSNEADSIYYIPDFTNELTYDHDLVKMMNDIVVNDTINKKKFFVLHTYGSHFNYLDRDPENYAYFTPDRFDNANLKSRENLINAFDNTIRYVDSCLADAINALDSLDCSAALVYAADHGEDIYDDKRKRFLHASPIPTSYQLHVPMIVWTSEELDEINPDFRKGLEGNTSKTVSSTVALFHTICTLAGLDMPSLKENESLTSCDIVPFKFKYVSDRNECYSYKDMHFPKVDKKYLSEFDIEENKI